MANNAKEAALKIFPSMLADVQKFTIDPFKVSQKSFLSLGPALLFIKNSAGWEKPMPPLAPTLLLPLNLQLMIMQGLDYAGWLGRDPPIIAHVHHWAI